MPFNSFQLKELASIQTGPFGSQLHKEDYCEIGTPIVTVEHLGQKNFSTQNLPKVSNNDVERLKKYLLKPGDIVFSRVGSVDRCSYVSTNFDKWLFSGRCLRIRVTDERINSEYLYYYFCQNNIKEYVRSVAVGATMPSINTKIMGETPIRLPSRKNQDLIVNILSSLDEKIEINDRIIKSIENLSISLVSHAINISKSEKSVQLSEYALLNPNRKLSKDHVARYIGMSSLSTSISTPEDWEFKSYKGGVKFKNGDTLVARITPCLENNKGAFINILEEDEIAFGSTEYIVISSKGDLPNEFFYCLSKTKEFRDYAIKHLNGTSGRQRVSADDLAAFCLPIFSPKAKNLMQNYLPSLFTSIANLSRQNKLLTTMRNTLLPKLLSGEIELTN